MTGEELDRLEALLASATPCPQVATDQELQAACDRQAAWAIALYEAAPELITLARRGLRAERDVCETLGNRLVRELWPVHKQQ